MSKTKTSNHQFFYEGLYWSSREHYAAWLKSKYNAVIDLRGGAL